MGTSTFLSFGIGSPRLLLVSRSPNRRNDVLGVGAGSGIRSFSDDWKRTFFRSVFFFFFVVQMFSCCRREDDGDLLVFGYYAPIFMTDSFYIPEVVVT